MNERVLLIVCDEPLFNEYLASVLSAAADRIYTAQNGKIARELLETGLRPSQIWLEWMTLDRELFLDFLTGTEGTAQIPLIIIVAFMGNVRVPWARAVVERPFTPDDLCALAEKIGP